MVAVSLKKKKKEKKKKIEAKLWETDKSDTQDKYNTSHVHLNTQIGVRTG